MVKSRLPAIGFWSYTRADDDEHGRPVSQLKTRVAGQLRTQLGRDVKIFQDVASIRFGAPWRPATQRAVNDSSFFIPVITPSFMHSPECRDEFSMFLERQERLQADHPELAGLGAIFPIFYADTSRVDTGSEIRERLSEIQGLEFEPLNHLSFDDPAVKLAIKNFAKDICNLLQTDIEGLPPPPVPTPPPSTKKPPKTATGPIPPPPPPPSPVPLGDDDWATARAAAASNEKLIKGALLAVGIFLVILVVALVVGRSGGPYGYANNAATAAVYDPCAEGNTNECVEYRMENGVSGMDATAVEAVENRADAVRDAGDNRADAIEAGNSLDPETNTPGL